MIDNELEFPFEHKGVVIEQDDGGLWVEIDGNYPNWVGPRALAALRASWGSW